MRQWDVKKEAALSRITEQRMNKEAVEAENAANNAKLAEHLVHVSTDKLFNNEAARIHNGRTAHGTAQCLHACSAALQQATGRAGRGLLSWRLAAHRLACPIRNSLKQMSCLAADQSTLVLEDAGFYLCFSGQESEKQHVHNGDNRAQ